MNCFWLIPEDQRFNNWILHHDSPDVGVSLRERYASYACKKCKKVDEEAAIADGIDREVTIQSKSDFLTTDDGFICVSQRLKELLEDQSVQGVRYLSLPADDRYMVAMPSSCLDTNLEKVGMECHRPCPVCGRYRETCFFPSLQSIAVPEEPNDLYCPSVFIENTGGRQFLFFTSEDTVRILRSGKISGLEYRKTY